MSKATYYFLATGGVGYTPDGTIPDGGVPCTAAQYQNPQQYFINGATTPPTISPVSGATALQLAQANQIMLLSQSCENTIYSGYISNALGGAFLYPTKATDQMNMISSILSAIGSAIFDAEPWTPDTFVVEEQIVYVNRQLYQVTENGTTGDGPPNWTITPGEVVQDGSAQWVLWSTLFWCADTSVNPPDWEFRAHTARQMWQVGKDSKQAVLNSMGMNSFLGAEVMGATTIQAVEAITWP